MTRASPKRNIKIGNISLSKQDIGCVKAIVWSSDKDNSDFIYHIEFPKIGVVLISLSQLDIF
jgi:hypothetical protein